MKKTQKAITLLVTMIIAVVFVVGNTVNAQQAKAKPWTVPDKNKTIKAPDRKSVV